MIKSLNELRALYSRKFLEMEMRQGPGHENSALGGRKQILLCGVAGCQSAGSMAVYNSLNKMIEDNNLEGEIKVISTG